MTRIYIRTTNESGETTTGWFDDEATQLLVTEGGTWDGNNWIGQVSGLQYGSTELHLTRDGRWVEHIDARRDGGGPDSWQFITSEQARHWLMRAASAQRGGENAEAALAEHFPDTPEESGPSAGGRPKIGPPINVAYPPELLKQIDAAAHAAGVTRAAWLRRIAEQAVQEQQTV